MKKVWKVLAIVFFPITIALWILNFIIGFILGIFGINWQNILIRLFTGKWPGEYIDEDEFKIKEVKGDKTSKDIKLNEVPHDILKNICWDLTYQEALTGHLGEILSQEDLDLAVKLGRQDVVYFLYVDVWNYSPKLVLMYKKEVGVKLVGRIEDVPSYILCESVEEVGGMINQNGHYPIGLGLETYLHKRIDILLKEAK